MSKRIGFGAGTPLYCVLALSVFLSTVSAAVSAQDAAAPPAATRALGTIKSISENSLTLTTDAGQEISATLSPVTKFLRIAPGEKDLKQAASAALEDLKVGDRVLVLGARIDDKSVQARSVIVMKQEDIADKQARERRAWQQGANGLVKSVDTASGAIALTTNGVGSAKEVTIQTSSSTIFRKYSAGSVKFEDAKTSSISEVKAGDQLRARGKRNEDGTSIAADEIVSGTFRNIAGTILSTDAAAKTVTITDLATKSPVTVHISSDTQMRKIPPMLATRIAARLKGGADVPAAGAPGGATPPAGARPEGASGRSPGGPGGNGGGDFQQMISRLPAASIGDLQKGDAVMLVATSGTSDLTAITLLSGVEQLLQASPKGASDMVLSPWSLGGGGGEGAGAGGAATP